MNKDTLTNVAASVRMRLFNLARESREDFGLLLSRFAIERLLYRISISPHCKMFLLKGAVLFTVWKNLPRRPTRDIDFQGIGDSSPDHLMEVFRSLCEIEAMEDGMRFDAASIQITSIRNEQEYGGLRVRLNAYLADARIPLWIDIGFGDAVTPPPREADYPTILSLPAPRVQLYPPETVIAEKWQAMVELGFSNSRMKDFYDLWILSRHIEFDGRLLSQAIYATFERRRTSLPLELPVAFREEFCEDSEKRAQWQGFTRKSQLQNIPELFEVVRDIRNFLWPLTEALRDDNSFVMSWIPGKGWH